MGNSVSFCTRKEEKCSHCGEIINTILEDEIAFWNKYNDLTIYIFDNYYSSDDNAWQECFEITEEIILDIIDKVEKGLIPNEYGSSLEKLNKAKDIILDGEKVYIYIR